MYNLRCGSGRRGLACLLTARPLNLNQSTHIYIHTYTQKEQHKWLLNIFPTNRNIVVGARTIRGDLTTAPNAESEAEVFMRC